MGTWSEPQYYRVSPLDNWEVGVLGDSISHGGGHFSFGPADFEFSYLSYLDFPAINLSQSGDTAQMTRDRFDADVLPFKPHYLLIMTGSNSLRAGEDPQVVIDCLIDDAVGIPEHHENYSDEIYQAAIEIGEQIKRGAIVPPATAKELKAYKETLK